MAWFDAHNSLAGSAWRDPRPKENATSERSRRSIGHRIIGTNLYCYSRLKSRDVIVDLWKPQPKNKPKTGQIREHPISLH